MEGKAEKMLKDFGKKIDNLLKNINNETVKEGFDERLQELRRNRDKIVSEINGIRDNNSETLQEVGRRLERSLEELVKAVEAALGGKTKKGS
jgi:DNA-directed RNA polymerase sigma subunit (sigma70/sigma32)